MSVLKKLAALLQGPAPASREMYYYVRCRRCGEVIKARANLYNDLSIEYGANEQPSGYVFHKVLVGRGRCFQSLEVGMTFDAQRHVVSREVTGGEFVTAEEYERAAHSAGSGPSS